jgi:YidC/Oxa1 family membrane protein insertase
MVINIFYTIIIYPLLQIIEVFFRLSHVLFDNDGISIVFVSLAVTLLSLPLYIIAEKWQQIERDVVKKLKPRVDKIKKVFKGDEQYFILSTYYKQNHYHPAYALRNSFGILIQIPFFLAAYTYLSNLEALKGSTFFFLKDLSSPDSLFHLGTFSVNILPIIMTIINIASSFIYTKNLSKRDKIQLYAVAVVFLLLLYNSPSGLVLYWTINNILSLVKNIFYKIRKPKLILYILSCLGVIFLDTFLLFVHHGDIYNRVILSLFLLIIPALPLIVKLTNRITGKPFFQVYSEKRFIFFILPAAALCILTGFTIPSFIISSSPQEFSYINTVKSPFSFLYQSSLQAFGFFVFWPGCIYFLFSKKIQSILSFLFTTMCFLCLANAFCFSGNYGEISSMLTFANAGTIKPMPADALLNISVLGIIILIIFLILFFRKTEILFASLLIIIIAQAYVSVVHSVKIEREFNRYTDIAASSGGIGKTTVSPVFHLSKEGKNVIVIMLDRAVNGFIPEIFSESPDLYEKYSGFVYYPNTLSFNNGTLMGAPPLFGSYEYTPEEINKRSSESLVEKHNEALLVMPRIFLENGFSVTVTDQPWANYSWIPDIRIYNNYPGISAFNTKQAYTDIWIEKNTSFSTQLKDILLRRNFIWLSFFKISPFVLRDAVYKNGEYWNTDRLATDYSLLLDNYAVLDFLPQLTDTMPKSQNTALLITNDLTHEPNFLQAPDYVPLPVVTNFGNSKFAGIINYHTNAAAIKRLGAWFEFLKQNGVYDNTRIIIVSDHGADIDTGVFENSESLTFKKDKFNPLLLVKNFYSEDPLKTDSAFMTNADVPILAFNNLIPNPVNPFTGNPVRAGKNGYMHIATADRWEPAHHSRNTFTISPEEWYSVRDNIFLDENWIKGRK